MAEEYPPDHLGNSMKYMDTKPSVPKSTARNTITAFCWLVFYSFWRCLIAHRNIFFKSIRNKNEQNNLIREYIARMVKKKPIDEPTIQKLISPDLVIDTVERIQGQERDVVVVSLTASDEEHIKAEKEFLMMPNRMNVSFTRPRTKLIVVGSKKLFRMIPADRDKQYEEVVDGRKVFRSKGVVLANHFKRWYFHAKEVQRVVEATALAEKPL